MNRTALWTLVLFFAGTVLFGGLRRLTDGEPAGTVIAVQLGALALVIAVLVVIVRWTR